MLGGGQGQPLGQSVQEFAQFGPSYQVLSSLGTLMRLVVAAVAQWACCAADRLAGVRRWALAVLAPLTQVSSIPAFRRDADTGLYRPQ